MPRLAKKIREVFSTYENIAEQVKLDVHREVLTGTYFELREQCETDGILKSGILYLTKCTYHYIISIQFST